MRALISVYERCMKNAHTCLHDVSTLHELRLMCAAPQRLPASAVLPACRAPGAR